MQNIVSGFYTKTCRNFFNSLKRDTEEEFIIRSITNTSQDGNDVQKQKSKF